MSDNDIQLDYAYLTQKALRSVIRDVLLITQELGDMPGEHHFYIEFNTTAPGVDVSDALLGAYPEKMTVVLQHKFDNLLVDDDHFEVTLHFKGMPDRLVIPFTAISNFVDPSCDYALRFDTEELTENEHEDADSAEKKLGTSPQADENQLDSGTSAESKEGGADVVSLDSFRKK